MKIKSKGKYIFKKESHLKEMNKEISVAFKEQRQSNYKAESKVLQYFSQVSMHLAVLDTFANIVLV